ncbi:hypothetical protein SAMN04488003_10274 [Loktanella fryxellensis]|uniref:Uncharacterized protein n=1 Tax=Loktanella fryxellensis TaxID=245187 RepID=A0A1H7ZPS8_9RHOB|nr:hypothetical protein [Loktanella fryxellensis]SEM60400.1 hypothetical protein SAMN04488003_10274 [Loktanella fryxellensis]
MRIGLLIVMLLVGSAAMAQERLVRSGAHSNFTRLAIPIEKGEAWRFGRSPVGYALEISSADTLDLSGIYDRIGRDRIVDVSVDAGRLNLDMSCNCHAETYIYMDRFIVIDIIDGPPDAISRFEDVIVKAEEDTSQRLSIAGPRLMRLPLAPGSLPIPLANSLAVSSPESREAAASEIVELERGVIDSLARAASQGLVELAEPVDDGVEREAEGRWDQQVQLPLTDTSTDQDPPAGPAQASLSLSATPGITYRTSYDQLQSLLSEQSKQSPLSSECWATTLTDFETSNDIQPDFATSISELRIALTDARDRSDAVAVAALAKGYLSFGFGEEALQTLLIDGVNDRSRRALRAMAEVVDGMPQSQPDLISQTGCSGSTALWAVLAAEVSTLPPSVDIGQIAREFKLLPLPLQTHLGPRLADVMNRSGHTEFSEGLLMPAMKLAEPPIASAVVSSELASSRGQISEAAKPLEALALRSPRMTPEAFVRLVDLQIEAGEVVADDQLALLETFAFEYRKQEVAPDIKRARTSALTSRGDLRAAFRLLNEGVPTLSDQTEAPLSEAIIKGAVAHPDDMLFLDFAFSSDVEETSSDTQNGVAFRLLDLGFPDRASEILESNAVGGAMAERRYLRATAAIAKGDSASARQILSGISTARAEAILSTAIEPGSADDVSQADRAFMTEDWSSLMESGDQLLQDTANLVQTEIDPTPDVAAPLASGRALIEDASQTRATLDTLVERFALPVDE